MGDYLDAYGKPAGSPEAMYQEGYLDGLAAGREAGECEIARLRQEIERWNDPCFKARDWLINRNTILDAENARLREALIAAEEAVRRYVPLLRPHDTGVVLQKIMTEAADRVATIARAALAEKEDT